MKGKKIIFTIFSTICLLSILIGSVNAYYLSDKTPGVWHLDWWVNEMCTTDEANAAIAAKDTWNGTVGDLSLDRYGYYSTGGIVLGDSYSELGFYSAESWVASGLDSQAAAITFKTENQYSHFDIVANRGQSWGNGNSTSYFDRQGVLTHEFGHAIGLYENFDCQGQVAGVNTTVQPSAVPTMFGSVYCNYNNTWYPCTYYQRDLTQDDKDGKLAVEQTIPGNP